MIFQHEFSSTTAVLALCQIYQNVMVSTSGIPECYNDNANSDKLKQARVLDEIALEDILVSVAFLKSDISRKLFFIFPPDMRRIGLEVYDADDEGRL